MTSAEAATVEHTADTKSGRTRMPTSYYRNPTPALQTGRPRLVNWHNRVDLSQTLTAVILAAGLGTRMRSRVPKVLHPLCGRPMVSFVLDAWNGAGVESTAAAGAEARPADDATVVVISPATEGIRDLLDGQVRFAVQQNPK